MPFLNPLERHPIQLAPGIQARSFWGENIMLAVVDFEPNAATPLHSHTQEQAGVIIYGVVEFVIAGEKRLLLPGDTYLIPGGVEHSAKTGEKSARLIDIFSPPRNELRY